MQLADKVRYICLVAVFLQAFVDDVDGTYIVAEVVNAGNGQTGFEFLEDLTRLDFKALAGLVVIVDRFLGGNNRGIAGEAGFLGDVG